MSRYQMTLPLIDAGETPSDRVNALFTAGRKVGKGFLPNMYRAMAHSPALLATYLDGYAAFRAESVLTPVEQEVVFLVISEENGCDYCVAAHSVVADTSSGVPRAITDAIRARADIPDARLSALARMTRAVLLSRGRPDDAEVRAFLDAGFSEVVLLDIVLAIAIKTLSNYTNHLFAVPLDRIFHLREHAAYKLGQRLVEAFRSER